MKNVWWFVKALWRYATGSLKEVFAEAFTARKINDPRVVRFYDINRHQGNKPFIVMEYFKGMDLQRYVNETYNGKPLPIAEALEIVLEISHALQSAHNLDTPIAHRDIKPNNILYNPENKEVKIIDFGIACMLPEVEKIGSSVSSISGNSQSIIAKNVAGTWGYMAPEQQRGDQNLDVSVDIFALAKTLMFLLTAKTPPPENIFALSAENRQFVGEFIGQCLMPNSQERLDIQEVIEKVKAIQNSVNQDEFDDVDEDEGLEEITELDEFYPTINMEEESIHEAEPVDVEGDVVAVPIQVEDDPLDIDIEIEMAEEAQIDEESSVEEAQAVDFDEGQEGAQPLTIGEEIEEAQPFDHW